MTIKIVLSGKKESGKSTVAKYITSHFPNSVELKIADPLKRACQEIFLLTDEQLENHEYKETVDKLWGVTPRKIYQKIGDLFRDNLQETFPELNLSRSIFVKNILFRIDKLESSKNPPPVIVISDNRFEDEYNAFKKMENTLFIRITRSNSNVDTHLSEAINFECEHTIDNNGSLQDLYSKIDNLLGLRE